MLRLTLIAAAILLVGAASADEWQTLELAHNSGAPINQILSADEAKRWDEMFRDGRGHATIIGRWSKKKPSVGVAKWAFVGGRHDQQGWIVATRKSGKIVSIYYTERPPKKSRLGWYGQGADAATTAVGLGMGFVEANPLLGGLPAAGIAGVKLAATAAVGGMDIKTCASGMASLGTAGWVASVWNLGVIAGAGPFAAIPAAAAGIYVWRRGDPVWQCVPGDLF